jgi:hypothetical protein
MDRPACDMTAVSCPEIRLMLDATKATVQHGKRLGTHVLDGHESSALASQQKKPKTVRLGNDAGIAVGSDAQDCVNIGTQYHFSIYTSSRTMYPFPSSNIITLSQLLPGT